MKVVHITWRDAAHVAGWRSLKAADEFVDTKLIPCESIGLLYHEDKKKVVLIQTHGDNEVMGLFEIPRGCIQTIKTIGKVKCPTRHKSK